jgi:hypothetical protein
MLARKWLPGLFFSLSASCLMFGQHQDTKPPERDPQLLEILARVSHAGGGAQAVAAVHDATERGEITFFVGEGIKGPLTIQMMGPNYFRMDVDLPDGKKSWVIRNGVGLRVENERNVPMTQDGALNLLSLGYPLAHVAATLADASTDVSFLGIENRKGRSIYRIRVRGGLGLTDKPKSSPIAKDLLIDALTFDIVSVEDRPFSRKGDANRETPTRAVEYGDFRAVNGVRIPFSIATRLLGQKTLSISLTEAAFNSNLTSDAFHE